MTLMVNGKVQVEQRGVRPGICQLKRNFLPSSWSHAGPPLSYRMVNVAPSRSGLPRCWSLRGLEIVTCPFAGDFQQRGVERNLCRGVDLFLGLGQQDASQRGGST